MNTIPIENSLKEIKEMSKQLKLGAEFFLSNLDSLDLPLQSRDEKAAAVVTVLKAFCDARAEQRRIRNMAMAGFPNIKLLKDFDTKSISLPPHIDWEDIKSCDFVGQHQNLIMIGNPGTGKTHLSIAVAIKACELGYKPLFRKMQPLLRELSTTYERTGNISRILSNIRSCDLLVLDEVGFLPVSDTTASLFYELIDLCYVNKVCVIITSNFPLDEWSRVFTDTRMSAAIIDRLIENSAVLRFTGKSKRLEKAQQRTIKGKMLDKPLAPSAQ